MNGIDISNWDSDIDLDAVPFDFMICKATQGTTFVDKSCDRFVQKAIGLDRPWGVYHYVGGQGANNEAQHFVNSCKGYIGNGLLILDWESQQNSQWGNLSYLKELTQKVIDLTGVKPLIYASASVFPWSLAKELDCGAWVAQYANYRTTGYQDSPWNEGKYSCVIRQYSESGRLPGYSGNLDLNKAYITSAQWAKYANPSGAVQGNNPFDVLQAATDVIMGKYGMGAERRATLGANYQATQDKVNDLYKKANATIDGKYGNGATRKNKLGNEYDIVQYIVNDILSN